MQVKHRANVWIAGVAAPLARRIGHHRGELFRNHLRPVGQENRVVVALRHLAAVRPRQPGGGSQERFRLRENGIEDSHIAIQVLRPNIQGSPLVVFQNKLLGFAVRGTGEISDACPPGNPFLVGTLFHLQLAKGLIEPPRHFARQLHVRNLVFTHGNVARSCTSGCRRPAAADSRGSHRC